jgi:signal transduction histidine kinase
MQVFVNLLSNACKYSDPASTTRIEVGWTGSAYYVKDNGIGFDMEHAANIFGVFQRLHRTQDFEGTGVGLAIVQRIVERHGGKIWAEAEPGKGATFFFTLT